MVLWKILYHKLFLCCKDYANVHFKAPYQVGTSDMTLSKQSTVSDADSTGGCSYCVVKLEM
jgi:hypothetical protein